MKNVYQFYQNLFSNNVPVSKKNIFNYLKGINLPKHSMEQREPCKGKRCIKKWKTRKHQVIMVLQNNF